MIYSGKQSQPVLMEELDFKGEFHISQDITGHNAALIDTDVQKHTIALEIEKNSSKLEGAMPLRCLFYFFSFWLTIYLIYLTLNISACLLKTLI